MFVCTVESPAQKIVFISAPISLYIPILYPLLYKTDKARKTEIFLAHFADNSLFYAVRPYSFTAPIFTPFTKYFCRKGYNSMKGRIAATIPA